MLLTIKQLSLSSQNVVQDHIRNSMLLIKGDLSNTSEDVHFFQDLVTELTKKEVKNRVQATIYLLQTLEDQANKGYFSHKQAQDIALEAIANIRFDTNGYLFVFNTDYTVLSNPNKNIIGKNLKNYQDSHGNFVFQDLLKTAKDQGSGYLTYWWPLIDGGESQEKIGFVTTFPPWDWIVGTGLYHSDINAALQKNFNKALESIKKQFDRLTILGDGYFILFDEHGDILYAEEPLKSFLSKKTGSNILKELMPHSQNPEKPFKFTVELDNEIIEMESFVSFSPELKWYIASIINTDNLLIPARTIIRQHLSLLVIVLSIACLLVLLFINQMVHPLKKLTFWTQNLAARKFSPETTDLKPIQELSCHRLKEISSLAHTFLFLHTTLQTYLRELVTTTQEKEKIESQLLIAASIQEAMLPKKFSHPSKNFEIHASLHPAKEVSGDFYDFFFIDSDHICIVVGDVTDKGIPAALFMARSKTLLETTAHLLHKWAPRDQLFSPCDILFQVNNALSKDNDTLMFVTLFLGILNIHTGRLHYSNAGHLPPYLLRNGMNAKIVPIPPGKALGIIPDAIYKTLSLQLDTNDTLFIYSDGLTDTHNTKVVAYGEERILSCINNIKQPTPTSIVNTLWDDLQKFSQGTPPFDDVTMLALRYCKIK